MQIEHQVKQDIGILRLHGFMNMGIEEKIKKSLYAHMNNESFAKVIINFRDVQLIDSAGIGILMASYKLVTKRGGSLRLCEVNPTLKAMLSIAGLKKILDIYDTEEEALSKASE